MATPQIIPLPYHPNPCDWFERLSHLPHPVLLDSCHELSGRGRFDLISAAPLQYHEVRYADLAERGQTLQQVLSGLSKNHMPSGEIENIGELPFMGGLMGWVSYEAGYPQYQILLSKNHDYLLPCLQIGVYLWAVINDHHNQQSLLVAHPDCDCKTLKLIEQLLQNDAQKTNGNFVLTSTWQSNLDRQAYGKAFRKIQHYIRYGDCYQINLAQRFSARYQGDTWLAYQKLREAAAAPYSAYLGTNNGAILSLSPETFLRFDGHGQTESKPIKGTAARHNDPAIDKQTADALLQSAKNRAENLMIVDLLRNDLGQCCESGSIKVDELFTLESFATVHHLVSQISGKMRSDVNALDMLAAAFPGGSITGAPKKRAMEIIAELEPDHRSIYCGCIGYLSCDGRGEFNIAIRTLLAEKENLYCWAGGGIVSDSKEDEEYEESLSKVEKLLHKLQSRDIIAT